MDLQSTPLVRHSLRVSALAPCLSGHRAAAVEAGCRQMTYITVCRQVTYKGKTFGRRDWGFSMNELGEFDVREGGGC